VTAALLKAEGYDVVGVTLQLYDHGAATHRKGACCAGQDIHDARAVAERIAIPHYVLDYESRFKEAVIDRFAESYAAGETPVPCVDCNMAIKFRDLLETARELGAKVLATGHYVQSRQQAGGRALFRAREEERDQSYFLFAMTPEQLGYLRFPLGHLPKSETRALAERFGKTTVVSRDIPGFIVNRVLMPMVNEACFALYEGIASVEDIDQAVHLGLNHPLGPLALIDLIGLDTTLAILEVMHRELGDPKYRPCPLLRQYVAAGWLGRKAGRGFHRYPAAAVAR
jgi:hypothetical protein